MKKLIISVVVLFLFFCITVSCQTKDDKQKVAGQLRDIEKTRLIIAPKVIGSRFDTETINNWKEYVEYTFGVVIDMLAGEVYYSDSYLHDMTGLWKGLLLNDTDRLMGNSFAISKYKEGNEILPLNEFLEGSEKWELLPDEIKSAYEDAGGVVWAIPFDDDLFMLGRKFNNKWAKALSINLPTTLDDLYETMVKFTYGDPDNNKLNDTFGEYVSNQANYISYVKFKDVFEANGCYLTYMGITDSAIKDIYYLNRSILPFGYNPSSKVIENSTEKEALKDTFDFIELLFSNQLIDFVDNKEIRDRISNNKADEGYGCPLNVVDSYNVDKEKYSYIFSFEGEVSNYTGSLLSGGERAYVLSAYANQELATNYIPILIDIFYGTTDGYISGKYGETGDQFNYSFNDGILSKNENYDYRETITQLIGNLSWINQDIKAYDKNGNTFLSREEILQDKRLYFTYPKNMSCLTMLYDVTTGDVYDYNDYLVNKYNVSFTQFANDEVSSEELASQWQRISRLYDVNNKIDQLNNMWMKAD